MKVSKERDFLSEPLKSHSKTNRNSIITGSKSNNMQQPFRSKKKERMYSFVTTAGEPSRSDVKFRLRFRAIGYLAVFFEQVKTRDFLTLTVQI